MSPKYNATKQNLVGVVKKKSVSMGYTFLYDVTGVRLPARPYHLVIKAAIKLSYDAINVLAYIYPVLK